MSSMETAAAFPLRAPPKLVTRLTIVHLVEMILGGILMVFVVLPSIFRFSLVSASFWQIYGRFYVTGLFGTFFYVALTLPLSVILGFLMGWARVSRIRVFSWPASLYVNVFRGLPPLILVIFASLFGTSLVPNRSSTDSSLGSDAEISPWGLPPSRLQCTPPRTRPKSFVRAFNRFREDRSRQPKRSA